MEGLEENIKSKRLLKQMRKNIRISITKKTAKLQRSMKERASADEVDETVMKLLEKYKEAQELNQEFQSLALNEEDDPNWIQSIDDIITEHKDMAGEYIMKLDEDIRESIETADTSQPKPKVLPQPNAKASIIKQFAEDKTRNNFNSKANEDMMAERISFLYHLIEEKTTSVKLSCLHEKLMNKLQEIKSSHMQLIHDKRDDSSWLSNLEHQVDKCSSDVLEYIESLQHIHADKKTSTQPPINEQLERIKLPKFEGGKDNYFSWKAAFSACVDNTTVAEEIKLLHLKQCLQGLALTSIECLGHTATAYKKSLEILEKKFGGIRRQTAMYLEQVEQFNPLKNNNTSELERFSDLLDLLIVSFEDANRTEELGSGVLFVQLQKKLTNSLLTQYHRWSHEKSKPESVISLSEFVALESEFHSRASETINGITNRKTRTYQTQIRCIICSQSHDIEKCEMFANAPPQEKWKLARKHMLCYQCLKKGHTINVCRSKRQCNIENCKERHHTQLHNKTMETKVHDHQANGRELQKDTIISMRTVPVFIHHNGRKLQVNALLDDGSAQTFLNQDVAKALHMDEQNGRNITVDVFNGNDVSVYTSDVEFEISNCSDERRFKISSMTSKRVVGDMTAINWKTQGKLYPHLSKLPFVQPIKQGQIDILIGIDYPQLHESMQEIKGREEDDPRARLTPLGWTCVGKTNIKNKYRIHSNFINKVSMFANNQQELSEINTTLKRFWEIESIKPEEGMMSSDGKSILDEAKMKIKRSEDNMRYQVSIPWKSNKKNVKNNYGQAIQRLKNTESQLKKKPLVKKLYEETLRRYLQKGYIKAIPEEDANDTKWYLPHFPVVKMQKQTSKVRIVFDASAQHEGISLNDVIHQGPNLQQDLFKILTRFRKNKVALVCDISEMYMQVEIAPEDKKYFRFLWRDNDAKNPCIYEFQRVIFGGNASPFLAQLVCRENALQFSNQFPRAVETILKSTYMDDSLDSVDSSENAIQLYKDLNHIWKNAGMSAKKWLSNDPETLKSIPTEDRSGEIDLANISGLPTTKTLGIVWDAEEDVFKFAVSKVEHLQFTKRSFLKLISSIFDPLGFLSAFIVRAKIMMQTLWIKKLEWDENIDDETADKVAEWISELDEINLVKVPRCLSTKENCQTTELHIFVDASEDAMAVVVYLCRHTVDGTESQFVCSKTKVAPLEAVSTPRLELLAAELGFDITEKLATTLSLEKDDVYYWTDSHDVLGWIQNRSRIFKPFISHRVGKIQQSSNVSKWMYVPSRLNPADLASRGIRASDLMAKKEWYNGPEFIRENRSCWPIQPDFNKTKLKEVKTRYATPVTASQPTSMNLLQPNAATAIDSQPTKVLQTNAAHAITSQPTTTDVPQPNATHATALKTTNTNTLHSDKDWRLDPERFSSWKRLYRITAWILRFRTNCKITVKLKGPLTHDEIEEATHIYFRMAQKDAFEQEINELSKGGECREKSKIGVLCPKLDDAGILRANTRIEHAEFVNFNTRFPIILPRGHKITQLVVKDFHEAGNHVRGTNGTLSDISTQFWIISGREEIRSWETRCNQCKNRRSKMAKQIMAPLPLSRLGLSMKAFDKCGVDYAGPFFTKAGRGKAKNKRYLCLFTCVATRAVHLEIAYSLDTGSFLNAFWRFTHRRGIPSEMTSDNGKNFIAGEKEIRKLVTDLNQEVINEKTTDKGITWKFNPPYSPHHGGIFETMIKAAKKAMYSQISDTDITDEELITTITGAEAMLNSRPITYQSANPKDVTPLTPNHFLHGQLGGKFAPEIQVENYTINRRWKYVQQILGNFWRRWTKEWIPSIGKRNKWTKLEQNLKLGEIVVVMWPDVARMKWPIGRIVEAIEGKDGNVRTVKVLVKGKIYTRGLNSIYPLRLDEN